MLPTGTTDIAPTGRLRATIAALGLPGILAIAISLLGLSLRIEHALTFDGPRRGADYGAHMQGIRWMMRHHRSFDQSMEVNYQVRAYPPVFYAMGAALLKLTGSERSVAALAVVGWMARQLLLALILLKLIPNRRWSILAALSINAVLPLSVLTDGKVNPEGLHTSLFTVAVYFLWRMEREISTPRGIRAITAILFGLVAGLALLTKATAAVLPVACAIVILWRAGRTAFAGAWRRAWRILRPTLLAAATWCAVTGWWTIPNYHKYDHPFPHVWDLGTLRPGLPAQTTYRRPLGWLLPFQWKEWIEHPMLVDSNTPQPNFWATVVVGTWSDIYNRGFCRLQGGRTVSRVWGWDDPVWGGPAVWVTPRCMRAFSTITVFGLWITLAAAVSTLYTAWRNLRSGGAEGTLVLPLVVLLGGFFVMLFALTYPYDGDSVLNPRYLLPTSTPMSACLGFGLARLERSRGPWARAFFALTLAAIGAVTILLVLVRWGR